LRRLVKTGHRGPRGDMMAPDPANCTHRPRVVFMRGTVQ